MMSDLKGIVEHQCQLGIESFITISSLSCDLFPSQLDMAAIPLNLRKKARDSEVSSQELLKNSTVSFSSEVLSLI